MWAQCGGENHKGSTCCPSGASCIVTNKWHSQCKPGAGPVASPPSSSPPATCPNTQHSQCGGRLFTGDTCCPDGMYCKYQFPDLSQCVTGTAPPPVAPPPGWCDTRRCDGCGGSACGHCHEAEKIKCCITAGGSQASCCVGASRYMWEGSTDFEPCAGLPNPWNTPPSPPPALLPPSGTCTNAIWAQCGGENHKGSTCCPSGASCIVTNKWYSQCKPA